MTGGRERAGGGEAARTASCRALIRGGVDEQAGEVLTSAVVAERIGWCAGLVRDMTAGLLAGHWNAADVQALASGRGPDPEETSTPRAQATRGTLPGTTLR
jgi:hypothetical protein